MSTEFINSTQNYTWVVKYDYVTIAISIRKVTPVSLKNHV